MGMYTDLDMTVHLKDNTPTDVIDILKLMIKGANRFSYPEPLPNHPFFKTQNWLRVLDTRFSDIPELYPVNLVTIAYCGKIPLYMLDIHISIKNYDEEIELFLNWLSPYIGSEGYLGTYLYDEWDTPALIYMRDGNIRFEVVEGTACWNELDDCWLKRYLEVNKDEY